ncbi:MAG: sigma-70 family RNA polymerase sigma factor [Acidimicrobiia bacterium]|jgi:RNA polymerase sigma-70 factor (ECF subfamily)
MTAADARFADVYESFFRRVYAYCLRRIAADRVDDAVAEIFLVAWRRIDEVPEGEAVLPWLYGVAFKVLSTQRRGRSRQRQLEAKLTAVGVAPIKSAEDFVVSSSESDQVFRALARLKRTDQEILMLTVWEELPHAEIAIALGISVGAVKQRAHHARHNLTREYTRLEKSHIKPLAAQKGGGRWQPKTG